jgi:hypothetical protein
MQQLDSFYKVTPLQTQVTSSNMEIEVPSIETPQFEAPNKP